MCRWQPGGASRLTAAYTALNGTLPVKAAGSTTNLDLTGAGLTLDGALTDGTRVASVPEDRVTCGPKPQTAG
jgi:hypothetical protein